MTIDDAGLWCQIARTAPGSADARGRAALFLDRDGVIIMDTHFLSRAEDMRLIPGAAAAIARCNALRIPVVVVTNQSGIGRGYYDWEAFRAIQETLASALADAGGRLDAVLACAYHHQGQEPLRVAAHAWRKPRPGMLLEAARQMKLDLSRSWIIGDRASDLEAGMAAQLAGGTLVGTDGQDRRETSRLASAAFVVETAANLHDAVTALLEQCRLSDR